MARITAEDPADAPAPHAPAGLGSRIAARFAAAGGLPCDLPELHATVRIPDPSASAAVAVADEPQPDGRAPARGIRDAG